MIRGQAEQLRHVVAIGNDKEMTIIWDSDKPCPWNLRNVLRDHNWRERGLVKLAEEEVEPD